MRLRKEMLRCTRSLPFFEAELTETSAPPMRILQTNKLCWVSACAARLVWPHGGSKRTRGTSASQLHCRTVRRPFIAEFSRFARLRPVAASEFFADPVRRSLRQARQIAESSRVRNDRFSAGPMPPGGLIVRCAVLDGASERADRSRALELGDVADQIRHGDVEPAAVGEPELGIRLEPYRPEAC